MTEQEWLEHDAIDQLLAGLPQASNRKLRLFACGCCRLIPEFMASEPDRLALELTERDVDEAVGVDAFNEIEDVWDIRWYRRDGANATDRALQDYDDGSRSMKVLVTLFRDIFGNPFRPVAFDPAWRTDTAVSLARQMYESREFGAMPILADALLDAGCDNPDILNHCRDTAQGHVRGCWVVDLVLGKA